MQAKLGIWAPSSPTKKAEFQAGLKRLEALGIQAVIPELVRKNALRKLSPSHHFLAGADSTKVRALEELWKDRSFDKIMAVRGGAGSLRLLELLEKARFLRRREKEIWGFSDLTTIQNYLFFKYGYGWVHSPMLSSPAFYEPGRKEKTRWENILMSSEKTTETYQLSCWHRSESHKSIRGDLFGGNLHCLVTLAGGPWDQRQKNAKILFLEDLNEPHYRLDRLLQHLSYARFAQDVRAVLVGQFTACDQHRAILIDWARRKNFSLFARLPCGHERPNIPIAMGRATRIEISSQKSAQLELPAPALG